MSSINKDNLKGFINQMTSSYGYYSHSDGNSDKSLFSYIVWESLINALNIIDNKNFNYKLHYVSTSKLFKLLSHTNASNSVSCPSNKLISAYCDVCDSNITEIIDIMLHEGMLIESCKIITDFIYNNVIEYKPVVKINSQSNSMVLSFTTLDKLLYACNEVLSSYYDEHNKSAHDKQVHELKRNYDILVGAITTYYETLFISEGEIGK
jgi:hypothetical protein